MHCLDGARLAWIITGSNQFVAYLKQVIFDAEEKCCLERIFDTKNRALSTGYSLFEKE